MMHSTHQLKDLANVTAGHPIRGAVRNVPAGDVAVVQIKNVDAVTGIDWLAVARTKISGRRKPDWLQPGDILFSARGQRNVAVCVADPPARAVCSPHFFLVRINEGRAVLPEFLAWQINLPQAQTYFARTATGSFITSIRRQVLEQLPIHIPSLERQSLLVRLSTAVHLEKELLERLIESRRKELNVVAAELLGLSLRSTKKKG